jgi:hypothetical protein
LKNPFTIDILNEMEGPNQGTSFVNVSPDIHNNLLENTKLTPFTYSWYSSNFIPKVFIVA